MGAFWRSRPTTEHVAALAWRPRILSQKGHSERITVSRIDGLSEDLKYRDALNFGGREWSVAWV